MSWIRFFAAVRWPLLLAISSTVLLPVAARASLWVPDPSVNPNVNSVVHDLKVQDDGKFVAVGSFSQVSGRSRNRIARFHTDGTLDTSFDPGTGADLWIGTLSVRPDGKLLIGGGFKNVNGQPRALIAQLHADGALDTSFDPASDIVGHASAIAVMPNGKVLMGGGFSWWVNSRQINNIARLNENGTLDVSFDLNMVADQDVRAIDVQSNGRVLLGGYFSQVYDQPRKGIARLNVDDTLDASFNPSIDGSIEALVVQPDGKILIGGRFTQVNGQPRNYIARLNPDGTLDHSFDTGAHIKSTVLTIELQVDGRVLVGGHFIGPYGSNEPQYITRLNADGTLDASFKLAGYGVGGIVNTVATQADGKVLIGGWFSSVNNQPYKSFARLMSAWQVTPSAVGGGTITPESLPDGVFNRESASFTLIPYSGYAVAAVEGTCGGTLAGNTFTTLAVTSDCTVIANFSPILPVFTHGTPPAATVNQPYSFTVATTAPVNFLYGASGLPAGLTIDPTTGVISGLPAATGSNAVTITARGPYGAVTQTITLVVNAVAIAVAPVPTLGEWGLMFMGLLAATLGARHLRNRQG